METGGVGILAPTTTSAFTATLRISQGVYEVKAVGEQTRDLLDITKHIHDSMSNVRIVRHQKYSLLTATEKEWIDNTIETAEKAVRDVAALIEPARVDIQTKPNSIKDIRSENRVDFVLRDSPNVATELTKLSIATQGLKAAMVVLCNNEDPGGLRKLNGRIIERIEQRSSSPSKKAPPYELSEFMKRRRGTGDIYRSRDLNEKVFKVPFQTTLRTKSSSPTSEELVENPEEAKAKAENAESISTGPEHSSNSRDTPYLDRSDKSPAYVPMPTFSDATPLIRAKKPSSADGDDTYAINAWRLETLKVLEEQQQVQTPTLKAQKSSDSLSLNSISSASVSQISLDSGIARMALSGNLNTNQQPNARPKEMRPSHPPLISGESEPITSQMPSAHSTPTLPRPASFQPQHLHSSSMHSLRDGFPTPHMHYNKNSKVDTWGKSGPPKPIMPRRAKSLAQEFATRDGTFRLGIGEPAFDDLDILGSAVPLDDGNAEGDKDPKGSIPESPPATVNTSIQDDTTSHPPSVGDLDRTAAKDDTKKALEYHTEVLDGTLSPTKRPSLEEVKEVESEHLWQHERQRRIVLYFLSWHFPSMYGALCGMVTMALLIYLFGAYGLMTVLWTAIPIAVCLRRLTLPRGLSKSLHYILVSPIVAFRRYLPIAKKIWRPSLQAGHRRIEWVCDCGQNLYADFDNSNPDSINELVNILTRPDRIAVHTAGPDPQASATPTGLSSQTSNSTQTIGLGSLNSISPGNQVDILVAQPATPQRRSVIQRSFLELCVNTGKFRTTLHEISLVSVSSDSELFRKIKDGYIRLRGFRATRYFLIEPVAVEFVRFCVEERHRVGILEKPLALPPEEEIIARRYQYKPCPLRPPPPIPSNVFVHYFNSSANHPRSVWIDRLPKKLQESIQNSNEPLPMGWGIHIIEGPNRHAIFWMLVLFVCLSLLASCMWTVLKGDIQGGFGVGAWMVSVPSVVMLAFVFKWSDD